VIPGGALDRSDEAPLDPPGPVCCVYHQRRGRPRSAADAEADRGTGGCQGGTGDRRAGCRGAAAADRELGADRRGGAGGAMVADGDRRLGPAGHAYQGQGRTAGAARVHRAAPLLREHREPDPRGNVLDHVAVGCCGLAVRDAERRRVDGGGGRREAARAACVRGLPPPPSGPRAAREGRGQSVQRTRVPDRRQGAEAPRDLVQPGAAGRALRAAAPWPAEGRARRCVARRDRRRWCPRDADDVEAQLEARR
jgi:hypothetical protein